MLCETCVKQLILQIGTLFLKWQKTIQQISEVDATTKVIELL